MSSSYLPVFPNLTFKTVFVASLSRNRVDDEALKIIAVFAVTSTSFFNSSLQANVVSRMEVDDTVFKLVELFVPEPSTTTSNKLSTIQMTPVLHLKNFPHPDTLINTLKNSTYFTRSLKHLSIHNCESRRILPVLENLVALEVLDLGVVDCESDESEQQLSVISRLPSLIELRFDFRCACVDERCGFFTLLSGLENNDGFRKLLLSFHVGIPRKKFQANFARLCAKNLLTHLSLFDFFTDDDLDVLIDAKLTRLRSLSLKGSDDAPASKIADAIIACSSSLTTLNVDVIADEDLIKCADYLDKLVELQLNCSEVNGSFLREKGGCFASQLKILNLSWSCVSDEHVKDGFKHLSSLRVLIMSGYREFIGAESLQYLTAVTSLEELHLSTINGASLKAVGQLTQIRWLGVRGVDGGVTSDDVMHLKSLVNLRRLIFFNSSREIYDGIFKIAESFQKLEYVELAHNVFDKSNSPKVSRDQVTDLLEKCWPLVRYAAFEYEDPASTMPYLRRRFPHVSFGDDAEEVARQNQANTIPAIRQRSP